MLVIQTTRCPLMGIVAIEIAGMRDCYGTFASLSLIGMLTQPWQHVDAAHFLWALAGSLRPPDFGLCARLSVGAPPVTIQ
jgi:hypothetical protein